MAKYRKKPVVIEAVQWDGVVIPDELSDWIKGSNRKFDHDGDDLIIHTLEGDHRANPGDWIIKGVQGELYPCKPDIFEVTYEAADKLATMSDLWHRYPHLRDAIVEMS